MKTPSLAMILAAAMLVALNSETHAAKPRGEVIGSLHAVYPAWFKTSFLDLADDAAEAGAAGKHAILFFDSEGCPYCYRMLEDSFKGTHQAFIREHFDVIALNVRGDREVAFSDTLRMPEKEAARQLEVRFTPTMLFLDEHNQSVLRVDGYRSVEDFGHLLHYVAEGAYRQASLSDFLDARPRAAVYRLRSHPSFSPRTDLSGVEGPLMVLFEDETCTSCDELHDHVLTHPLTRELLRELTVVRLDARSSAAIVEPGGRSTTPRQWAADLDMTYRPGVVLFDGSREVYRIDGYRRTFHFQQVLRYVVGREWERYASYREFAHADREAILARGEDVDVRQ